MDVTKLWTSVTAYCTSYPLIAIVIGILLVLYAWREPKEAFKIAMVLVALGLTFYLLSLFGQTTSTGIQEKDEMIYKTKRALGD